MKRILFFMFFLWSVSALTAQKNKKKIYINDDSISLKPYTFKYIPVSEMVYKMGVDTLISGNVICKDKKGKLKFDLNLDSGLFHGLQKIYYDNGKLNTSYFYKKGKIEGVGLIYHLNGKLNVRQNFSERLQNGLQEHWTEEGKRNFDEIYVNGVLEDEKFYAETNGTDIDFTNNPIGRVDPQPGDCIENVKIAIANNNVQTFKNALNLNLIVDSVELSGPTVRPKSEFSLTIKDESELIKLTDTLYIKIFLIRAREYESAVYKWKFDYYRKTAGCFVYIWESGYQTIKINSKGKENYYATGYGLGIKGEPGYFSMYLRYRFE
ncbi:MAG: hypothetical protein IAF38_16920 [Bacteroidia bacterium]|nr:hypothetical protein [Bacteroidia bacterium]